MEYTHFIPQDPIEELIVVVQFPEDFTPEGAVQLRVVKPDTAQGARDWARQPDIELNLRAANALRYVESARFATLVVPCPQPGLSYGIEWAVPQLSQGPETGLVRRINQATERMLKLLRINELPRDIIETFLMKISLIIREVLLDNWKGQVEVNLMLFDERNRKHVPTAIIVCEGDGNAKPHAVTNLTDITFDYGEGIAGRAFKSNEVRLYIRETGKRTTPVYYRELPGQTPHQVLMSVPLRSPSDKNFVYATVDIGSRRPGCPLDRIGDSKTLNAMASFRDLIDRFAYDNLCSKFIEEDT